jgi:hypothetical protein
MQPVFVINIDSESGDHYGPYVVENKPNKKQLKKWLKNKFPCEFTDDEGPGDFGSYLFVHISEVYVAGDLTGLG